MNTKSELRDWKEFWKEKRILIPPATHHQHQKTRFLYKHALKHKNGNVLELGCYPGKWLIWFHNHLNMKPYGVDLYMAQETRDIMNSHHVDATITKANALHHPYKDNTFDVVYSFGLIEHFDNTEEIIAQHTKVLKQGGTLILSWPNTTFPSLTWIMMKLLSPKDFNDMRPLTYEHITRILTRQGLTITETKNTGIYGITWIPTLYTFKFLAPLFNFLSRFNFFAADFTVSAIKT